jgi:DegV family protein with EDD domain
MYGIARTAREQVVDEFPSVSIEIFDSLTSTAAEGFIALAAAREAMNNKNLKEIVDRVTDVREKVNFLVLLDTIRHVYRSGRIPKIAAQIGSLTQIKPILTMSSGLIRFAGAIRTKKRGIDKLLMLLRSKVGGDPVHIAIMHAYALEEANNLMERVSSEFNCAEIWLTEFSPVMGYVCGTGTVGFAFYKE